MNLKICKLHPDAIVPKYQTGGAACFDLHALLPSMVVEILPGDYWVFRTGLAFEVPEGYALMIYSRSGHGFKNSIRLANCVGVIDSDYRGEVMVKLQSDQSIAFELDPQVKSHATVLHVTPGARIAQAMLVQVPRVTFEVVEQLSLTDRGTGGLGSTGQA